MQYFIWFYQEPFGLELGQQWLPKLPNELQIPTMNEKCFAHALKQSR